MFRQDFRQDLNRFSGCVTDLIEEMAKTVVVQQAMLTSFKEMAATLKELEMERVAVKAKWTLISDLRPVYQKLFQIAMFTVAFSITFHSTTDLFYWAKDSIRIWTGL